MNSCYSIDVVIISELEYFSQFIYDFIFMEIKKHGDKALVISNKVTSILAFPEELSDSKIKSVKPGIALNKNVEGAFSVLSPGEYESDEVWVMSMPSNLKKDDVTDVFVVNIDEVRVALFDSSVTSLNKKQIEKIGIIDILILDLDVEELKSFIELVGEIDPQIIIPLSGNSEKVDLLIKKLGLKSVREESKLKIKMEDFAKEDFQLELVKLS